MEVTPTNGKKTWRYDAKIHESTVKVSYRLFYPLCEKCNLHIAADGRYFKNAFFHFSSCEDKQYLILAKLLSQKPITSAHINSKFNQGYNFYHNISNLYFQVITFYWDYLELLFIFLMQREFWLGSGYYLRLTRKGEFIKWILLPIFISNIARLLETLATKIGLFLFKIYLFVSIWHCCHLFFNRHSVLFYFTALKINLQVNWGKTEEHPIFLVISSFQTFFWLLNVLEVLLNL